MERKDAIRSAYRMTGSNSFYDGMITCSTPGGKAVCRLVWDRDKAECDDYLEKALSGIPEGFSGKLLEVPVGTGAVCAPELTDADLLRGHVPAHPRQRLRGADGEDGSAAADVHISPARLAARICSDPGHSAAAGRGGFHLGFCTEPRLRERSALHLDGGKRRLGRAAAENRGGKMTWMKK